MNLLKNLKKYNIMKKDFNWDLIVWGEDDLV